MKKIIFSMFVLFGLCISIEAETYKIYVQTFESEIDSVVAMDALGGDSEISRLQKRYDFSIFNRTLGDFFVIGIGSFEDKAAVLQIYNVVHQKYKDALIITTSTEAEETGNSTSQIHVSDLQNKDTVSKKTWTDKSLVADNIDYGLGSTDRREAVGALSSDNRSVISKEPGGDASSQQKNGPAAIGIKDHSGFIAGSGKYPVATGFIEKHQVMINLVLKAVVIILQIIMIVLVVVLLKRKGNSDNSRSSLLKIPNHQNDWDEFEPMVVPRYENELLVDLHSHLIPGIDDGSNSMEESIEMILKLKSMGYRKLITTPHTMSHRFANTPGIILKKLEELRRELDNQKIDIEIEAASEYYLDEYFMASIEKGDVLTFNGNYLLFEMSYMQMPVNFEEIIFKMQAAGYQPVLAHPERYRFLYNNFEKYEWLKGMGVLFQLNINSLSDYYSKEAKKTALKLIANGMINFLGSDVHKLSQLDIMEEIQKSRTYKQIFKNNKILNNTLLRASA
jgi:tyrosine-protein phosphatase YwqE